MKTNFLKATLLVALALVFTNCSKDDDEPQVNPLTDYVTAAGFNEVTTDVINGGDYEFGYSFMPTVNGKIKAIVAKIPDAHTDMRVTIWDVATETVLRTELLTVEANVEVTKIITALSLTKNKEYMITFNSDDWYNHKRTDNSNATYPFTSGDIMITGYGYASGTAQTFPVTYPNNYYAGDVSFKFQKN
jgi:hypothetical protein